DLNPVIDGIGRVQVAIRPEGKGADAGELPGLVALLAPALHEPAVAIQLRNALILAELGDVKKAVSVLDRVADVAELSGARAHFTAEFAQLGAVGRVDAQAVIVRIANDEVAVAVDAQPAGPAVAVVGCLPARKVVAVTVEHLNAGGEIDDVEPVLAVEGGGARPDEVARPGASTAPDEIRFRGRATAAEHEQQND